MLYILQCKHSPKLDPLVLKCMPNLHNILDWAEIFTTKTRFELNFNPIIFIKNRLWMKEIWHAKIAIIQNVEFCKVAPLGIKKFFKNSFENKNNSSSCPSFFFALYSLISLNLQKN